MPFTNNPIDGTKIHYEMEGSGPPLLLIHGFGAPTNSWSVNGYVGALKDDYRVITYRVRAHGESGHPHDRASYTPEMHTADAVAVLDELGIDRTHVFGYSLGAWIGYAMLKHAPDRMRSLIAGGQFPYSSKLSPLVEEIVLVGRGSPEEILAWIEDRMGPLPERALKEFWERDFVARQALIEELLEATGLDSELDSITIPVLSYAGTEDPNHELAARAGEEILTARMVSLHGLDHMGAIRNSDIVLPFVKEFLAEADSANASG